MIMIFITLGPVINTDNTTQLLVKNKGNFKILSIIEIYSTLITLLVINLLFTK